MAAVCITTSRERRQRTEAGGRQWAVKRWQAGTRCAAPSLPPAVSLTVPCSQPLTSLSKMPAYVVVEVDIHDPERYSNYKDLAPPSIYQYGGRYIARGGKTECLEGDWNP